MTVQAIIAKRIKELEQKTELTVQKVEERLEKAWNLAQERSNLTAMLKSVELQGKRLAMFTDNLNTTDTIKQQELDEKAKEEAVRRSNIVLRAGKAG